MRRRKARAIPDHIAYALARYYKDAGQSFRRILLTLAEDEGIILKYIPDQLLYEYTHEQLGRGLSFRRIAEKLFDEEYYVIDFSTLFDLYRRYGEKSREEHE